MNVTRALGLLQERGRHRPLLVDVGARWGANERWMQLGNAADILCFEPDAEECQRLNEAAMPNVRYLPYALADREGPQDLHVTAEPACSSLYPPIPAMYELYPSLKVTRPEKVVSVRCRRLDDVLAEEGIAKVAALKLDTQGSELSVLRGATAALRTCSLIDVEVEFNPLYAGQALFCDVDRFLRDQGFVLWRLENLVHYAPETVHEASGAFLFAAQPSASVLTAVPNGQLFWSQAQYVRDSYPRTGAIWMPMAEACAVATLAGLYGFWDLAFELLRKTGDQAFLVAVRQALSSAT